MSQANQTGDPRPSHGSAKKPSEPQAEAKAPQRGSASTRGAGSASNLPQPVDENAVNAPSRQSLVMLSAICIATIIMWAAGRAACNYHVPGEGLTPRSTTLDERTRYAKDAALEFAQAMSGADFDVAARLARGEAAEQVAEEKKSCDRCSARRESRDALMSVPVVLRQSSVDAFVRVRTVGDVRGEAVRLLRVEREGRDGWHVTQVLEPSQELPELREPAAEPKPRAEPGKLEAPAAIDREVPTRPGQPATPAPGKGEAATGTPAGVKAPGNVPAPSPATEE